VAGASYRERVQLWQCSSRGSILAALWRTIFELEPQHLRLNPHQTDRSVSNLGCWPFFATSI
jgi:hypothetical protein